MQFPRKCIKGAKSIKYLKIWAEMYKIWKYFAKMLVGCVRLSHAINCQKKPCTLTEEILNGALHFLCSVCKTIDLGRLLLFQRCSLFPNILCELNDFIVFSMIMKYPRELYKSPMNRCYYCFGWHLLPDWI